MWPDLQVCRVFHFPCLLFSGVRMGYRLQRVWRDGQRRLAICSWFSSVGFICRSWNPTCCFTCFKLWSWFLYLSCNSFFRFPVCLCRSYHGYKTMKDFVRRRRWARYYKKHHWLIGLCTIYSAGTQHSESCHAIKSAISQIYYGANHIKFVTVEF